jgi:hypothetical protein
MTPPLILNGVVRFAERRNMVSARVPSHFKRCLASYNLGKSCKGDGKWNFGITRQRKVAEHLGPMLCWDGMGRQHNEGILIALGEMGFGENFEVNFCAWLHSQHAVLCGIWAQTQHVFWNPRKPREILVELAGRKTFRMCTDLSVLNLL